MADTQAQVAQKLTELNTQVQKIGTETTALKQNVQDLKDALANQANVTPELQAAVDALAAQVQTVDDLVPDAPVPPPPAP